MEEEPESGRDDSIAGANTPGIIGRLEFGSAALLQNGGKALNPPVYCSMIYRETSFDYHLFQIAVAQRVPQVPTNAQQDERRLKVAVLEELGLVLSWHEMGSNG